MTNEAITNRERKQNHKIYEENIADLRKKHLGKWVVIANGKIQAIGTFKAVKNIAIDANQRHIFQVKAAKIDEKIPKLHVLFKEKEAAAKLLGIQLTELRDGYAKMEIPLSGLFLQSEGIIFGGIATALADYVAAYSAMTHADTQIETAPTKELNIKFISRVTLKDKALVGEGRILSYKPYEDKNGKKRQNIVVEITITSKQTKKEKAKGQVESVIITRNKRGKFKIEASEMSELKKLLKKAEQSRLSETEEEKANDIIMKAVINQTMCYICEKECLDKNCDFAKSIYDIGLCKGHTRNIIYLSREK